jgi:hypothetical protein
LICIHVEGFSKQRECDSIRECALKRFAIVIRHRRFCCARLILSTAKDAQARRCCDLVVAMIDRLFAPRSKLGFLRAVDEETATTSLGTVLAPEVPRAEVAEPDCATATGRARRALQIEWFNIVMADA